MASLEEEIAGLYGLPLDEFIQARNALARQLKKNGDVAAERVQTLAKASVAVWAINQAARGDAQAVHELLRAGEGLRRAQSEALSGGGADVVATASAGVRAAVAVLVARAALALTEAGRAAGRTQINRIERTLTAAAIDPAAGDLLERGILESELEPGGFDTLAGLPPGFTPTKAKRRHALDDELAARRREKKANDRRKELEQRVRQAERQARDAEHAAEAAEAAAVEKRRAAESARAAADAAGAELADMPASERAGRRKHS